MIEFSGIEFRHVDNRVMSLQAGAAGPERRGDVRRPTGEVLQPSEVLYKKPMLVERGSFRPVTHVNVDMLRCAPREVHARARRRRRAGRVELMEITMRNLHAPAGGDDRPARLPGPRRRAGRLRQDGADLRLLRVLPAGRLPGPLHASRRSASRWAPAACCELFDEKYYAQLDGGILESFGRLFKNDLKLYIYPLLDPQNGELTTVENLQVAPELREAVRVPGRARLHRSHRQAQPGLSRYFLAQRRAPHSNGRYELGSRCSPGNREGHPRTRILRVRQVERRRSFARVSVGLF